MAFTTLCGSVSANPVNAPFLFVDLNLSTNGTNTATQPGFNGWNIPSPPSGVAGVVGFTSVSNFPSSTWAFSNSLTAPGPVTVTLSASNYLDASGVGSIFTLPNTENTGNSPDVVDRATMAGDPTEALYNDYIYLMHNANIGFGHDYFTLTFSNLFPGTGYEVTLWAYDPNHGDTTGFYNAAGTNNPALNPNFAPSSVNSATSNNPSVLIPDTGPWPKNSTEPGVAGNYANELYLYSGSLFVTTDAKGMATVYMWEADFSFGPYQRVPFNGFALGHAISWTDGPVITDQPINQTVMWAGTASFNVIATGVGSLNYQWSLNGTNILGATSSSLTISNVSQSDLGVYAVVVTNRFGTATSSNATLSMYPYLAVPFGGVVTNWGQDAILSVQAWGTGPLSYQWFDNGVAILNATNQTLSLSNIQFTNAGFYSVVVSSPLGSVTNAPEQVVVNTAGVSLGLYPGVTVSGTVGYAYDIQCNPDLTNTNGWTTVATLTLFQPVELWVDINNNAASPTNQHRFYRVLPGQ